MSEKYRKKLKVKIRPKMRVLNRALEGNWNTVFKGRGMEFTNFKQYILGDDARKIDWKASLRCGDVLVKELEEYHALNVFFLFDASNSMLCSSTGQLKSEYGAELISNLCYNIIKSGDAVGMGMFTDEIITKIIPAKGQGMHFKILQELENLKNYGGEFNLKKALMLANSFLDEGTMVIIVSDFIGLKEGWIKYIKILSRKYDLMGIMIRDPRDYSMPEKNGQYLLEDPFTKEKMYIDAHQYRKIYADEAEKKKKFVKQVFEKARMGFVCLHTDQDFEKPIIDYFRKRVISSR